MRYSQELRTMLESNLATFEQYQPTDTVGLKSAAVAIVVTANERNEAAILLTRRAPRLNAHAGQWALPGGKHDDNETDEEAACRELAEEINVNLEADKILGCLDPYCTRSGYAVTPVVFWGGDQLEPVANPDEVSSIHWITLKDLNRPGSPVFLKIPESDRPVIRLLIEDSQIHAPTAALLYQFREVAVKGNMIRVHDLEQPVWAWKK